MKTYFALMFLFALNYVSCQNNNDDYFFTEKGEKYLKPVKYILFNPKIHKVNQNKNKRFYYLGGESFVFIKNEHKVDTCNIKYLEKIKLSLPSQLSNLEYQFHKNKIKKKYSSNDFKIPMPLTKNHPYFKIIIIEIEDRKLIKYETNWTYEGTRGFRVN